jgi:hypothetical protein
MWADKLQAAIRPGRPDKETESRLVALDAAGSRGRRREHAAAARKANAYGLLNNSA